jgi:tripeptide aminopeptidase
MERLQLLKDVLSVPTCTYKEDKMVEFLKNYLTEKNYDFFVDRHKNVYVTKTSPEFEGQPFPCVVAHTDTVHWGMKPINVLEEMKMDFQHQKKLALKGYDDDGEPSGIGGDDKAGVFGCLVCLEDLPHVKVALFVSEETGCHGSKKADEEFFSNVGYTIQFDGPENYMITEVCHGVRLFDRESEFFNVIDSVFKEKMEYYEYKIHPYTDVAMLKMKFDFACVNISIGYYNYHTPHEYVVLDDVERGIDVCKTIIERLGNTKQQCVYERPTYAWV